MKKVIIREYWSPYFVGSLIGALVTFIFLVGFELGASTGIARISALISSIFASSYTSSTPYFAKILSDHVIFNWKILFIIGLFIGSMIASRITKSGERKDLIFSETHSKKWKGYLSAFVGGILLMIGARFANGCTSGQAISGGSQLSLVSFLFMMALFISGIPVATLLYRRKSGSISK